MSTSVPNSRESVHFRVDPNRASTLSVSVDSGPCCFEEIVLGDFKTLTGHERCEDIVSIAADSVHGKEDVSVSTLGFEMKG